MADVCAYCAASFGGPADLVVHVNHAHSGGDPRSSLAMNPESHRPGVVCAKCGRRFSSPEGLARHILSPHRNAPGRNEPVPGWPTTV